MERITILVKIGIRVIPCIFVGDAAPHVDGRGVHAAIRVYKATAHPSSTFTIRASQVIGKLPDGSQLGD